jgi:hypothetical protein
MQPYTKIPNKLFDMKLSPYELSVYIYLLKCGEKAFPSHETIANKTGMSKRKVIDSISNLEQMKLITKNPCYKDNKQVSNIYKLNLGVHHMHTEKEHVGTHGDEEYYMQNGRYFKGNKKISLDEFRAFWAMNIPGETYCFKSVEPVNDFQWFDEEIN